MVSAFGGDEIKTVLELGVAAEVEITDLLTTAAKMLPVTSAKKKFLKQQPKFVPKLCEWPQKLGQGAAEQFMHPGFPPDWVGSVRELYRFRNSVAHSGKIIGSAPMQHLFTYITAASALLAFSRSQRIKFGMPHYSYPAGRAPFGQMLLYRDGIMTGETSTSTGRKA